LSFNIYFDESHKIDKHTSDYAYYGILGLDDTKINNLDAIANDNKIFNELHFAKFKLDKIDKYLKLLTYALEEAQINIYIINTDEAFKIGDKIGLNESLLRKSFYIKIPERLIYGMTRFMNQNQSVNIIIDGSSDYGSQFDNNISNLDYTKIIKENIDNIENCSNKISQEVGKHFSQVNICKTIKEQLNSQALYRGLNYSIEKVIQGNSNDYRCLQLIDVLLGIIVFISEERYFEIEQKILISDMNKTLEKTSLTDDELTFLFRCYTKQNEHYICTIQQDDLQARKDLRLLNKKLKFYSQNSIQKAELIYRLLSEPKYLDKFSKFNVFLWGHEEVLDDYTIEAKDVKRYNVSKYISRFLDFKYKYDNENRLKIIQTYLNEGKELNYTEKNYKEKLGFGSNLKLLVRRYLDELNI